MKIEYTLNKEDILQMLLFMASLSEQIRRTRRNSHLWGTVNCFLLGMVIGRTDYWMLGVAFICIAVVWYFVCPSYMAKRYKKNYSKYVDENLTKRTEHPTELTFGDEYIAGTDYSGESNLKANIIERIDEVRDYCFMKLNSSSGIVIPLGQLPDREEVIGYLKDWAAVHSIPYHTDVDWKW